MSWVPTRARQWIEERVSIAPEVLRWRGPLRFALIAARELARPLISVRVIRIFETDLRRPIPELLPPAGLEVQVFADDEQDGAVVEQLAATGTITAAEVRRRFAREDRVVVARREDTVLGYAWLGFSSRWQPHLRATMQVGPTEVLHYDAFVSPASRGKGMHPLLIATGKRHARDLGCQRTVSWIAALNTPSLKVRRRFGSRGGELAVFVRPAGAGRPLILSTAAGRARFSS